MGGNRLLSAVVAVSLLTLPITPASAAPADDAVGAPAPDVLAEGDAAPETDAAPDADAAPESEPAETDAEPGAEPAPELEPEPASEPASAAAPAAVPEPEPESEEAVWEPATGANMLYYDNLTALRYNPLGFVNQFRIGYRRELWRNMNSKLFNGYADVKLHSYLSPAFQRIGPAVEIMPLAILRLNARYTHIGYFKTFDLVQSFDTPSADYRPSALETNGEAGDNYGTTGHMATMQALLQLKVWNIAVRNEFTAQWSKLDLREGDTVYYDQSLDVLFPNNGWVLVNDTDLLYVTDFGLKAGARYTLTHAQYKTKHFLPGEAFDKKVNTPHHRVGPAIIYTFFDRPGARFNAPTLILLVQWWAKHRWRTGTDVSAGLPYVVLGFAFNGQILPLSEKHPRKKRSKRAKRARR